MAVYSPTMAPEAVCMPDCLRVVAAVFLASACMLKICTLLRFKQRLGLTPTNQSCAAVLADCLRSLDDPDSADTRADHFALSKWPAELFDASLQK